ncbi:uncharacterized protein N0V89_005535 [Didymosphaeria variabile]|uniref:TLDc domain-containing protein n=1 Tax=Didymosphaeria variabile TaxID=1932322 RepID=A0A9W8XNC8_9PLEO|nr:uncharacterized protein N0V89_005535 [Didymosphaeria variabile]KAJ4353805.1 hypothetical protein N0V89_005535 [Didymosphaeria variabile]
MPPSTPEWLAEQYHAGHFHLPDAHHHILSDKEHEALANGFNNLSTETSEELRLERTLLVTRIQSQLPLGFPSIFADLVYRILACHSTAPFYKSSSAPVPQSLSLQDIGRALAWLLPDRHLSMSTTGTHGRVRTRADHRRLLFQSLATPSLSTANSTANEVARRRYARRNAFDVQERDRDYASINRDDDGDEMYHDLLDVLQNNAPENYPYGTTRDHVRPLARELKADFDFHGLAVPRGDLTDFVRALLALQFNTNQITLTSDNLRYLDDAVASVMATFTCDEQDVHDAYATADDLVAWPAFDQGLKEITHLFDPVYRVLNDVLLNGEVNIDTIPPIYGVPPELQPELDTADEPHVLSLGRLALANAIVPPLVDWDSFNTVARWHRSSSALPSSNAIWSNLQTPALEADDELQASTIAFTGRVRGSGERFVGGVLAAADYDGDDGREQIYSIYVFRLEPSVRYAKLLGQEWRQGPSGELVFDNTTLSGFRLDVGAMVVGMEVPGVSGEQVIELDGLEIWKDGQ